MTSKGETQPHANRRGGYGDGGGLTLDNKLPLAEAVPLANEAALRREMESIGRSLGSTVDWVDRIHAIIRLEGLILGGATQWQSFLELLRNLKDPLVAQICDRRSAVSRQACHVIYVLVSYLGTKFEHMAILFIPVLIKVLTITVQVMAEAADECLQWILHYCRSGRLLQRITDSIVSDKCPKIRQHCIKYLLQVFDNWSPKQYERYVDCTFAGLKASLQDASSETREIGRTAVAALTIAFPEKGRSLIKTLDGSLQKKLTSIIKTHKEKHQGVGLSPFQTPQKVPLTQTTAVNLTEIKSLPQMSSRKLLEDDSTSPEGSMKELRLQDDVQKLQLPPSQPIGPSRVIKSFTLSTSHQQGDPGNQSFDLDNKPKRNPARIHPYSRNLNTEHIIKEEDLGPRRLLVDNTEPTNHPESVNSAQIGRVHTEGKTVPFNVLLKQGLSQGNDWRSKEEILNQMIVQFEKQLISVPELLQSIQSLNQMFCSYLQDPHHKVVALTLTLISQFAKQHEALMESMFFKLAPMLFGKLVDAKSPIRTAATVILQNCVKFCSVETLLGSCVSSLTAIRIPKVLPEIMNYSSVFLNDHMTVSSLQGSTVRQWICQLCKFSNNKNPATRKSASDALEHCLHSIPNSLLKDHLSTADPQEQLILMRNLKQKYSELLPDFLSVSRALQKEGNKDSEMMDIIEENRSNEKQEVDSRILQCLQQCRTMKEVEKLDALTSLTDQICHPEFNFQQIFQTEILDESLGLFLNSGSAVKEQILIFLNDLILLKEIPVPLSESCKLFKFLISTTTDESNLVCLALDVILDTLLREIPPCNSFDLCLSCLLSLNLDSVVPCQFLRLIKVFSRLICFLDNKLVEKKLTEQNFQIIKLLIKQWNSDLIEIRKPVVCCLAQIGNKIPQKLEPLLQDVKDSERSLLQLYMEKMSEK